MIRSPYDIDRLIAECTGLSFIDVLVKLNKRCDIMDGIKNVRRHTEELRITEHEFTRFRSFMRETLFYLQTGIVPIHMAKDDFKRILPIVQSLVEQGERPASFLSPFERL